MSTIIIDMKDKGLPGRVLALKAQLSCQRVLLIVALALSCSQSYSGGKQSELTLCCGEKNDLLSVLRGSGIACERFDDPDVAVRRALPGSGLLLLADGYPSSTTVLSGDLLRRATSKRLRVYVEYPSWLPGGATGEPRDAHAERAVVRSDFFGPALPPLRILSINGLRFLPSSAVNAHLVAAQVAGFDSAVYGLPKQVYPLLYVHPANNRLLVATTKLSGFITGRYAPSDGWHAVWQGILGWLMPGTKPPLLHWTPTVRPSFRAAESLPPNIERSVFERGVDWFKKSKLLLHPSRLEEVRSAVTHGALVPTPAPDAPIGDGTLGILEGVLSVIQQDGSQLQSPALRGDCNGESAMAMAFGGSVLHTPGDPAIAANLLNHWYFESGARGGARGDPDSSAYGLIAWGVGSQPWFIANYGDDNARLMLGTLAAAALLTSDRWNEPVMRCLLANLRTTGKLGFRGDRIDLGDFSGRDWREFYNRDIVNYSPHNEAYLWACFLWAFDKTRDSVFLWRTENALRMTMAVYPTGWRWMNGLAQERARILLPLAWLVRVNDTPEHRAWLRTAVDGLLAQQLPCGAIREELGSPEKGAMPPPASNEQYGGGEASLIQQNGDPVSDQLYTTNFAFLGLHEAAAVGDSASREAEEKLAEYLCRIQVRSELQPSLDGGWFRAFDFKRWEPWGSNADAGWGAWSIESGWTQAWITSVLAMRQMKTSLWDLTAHSDIRSGYEKMREEMLPHINDPHGGR
jgi:hypothetical protein